MCCYYPADKIRLYSVSEDGKENLYHNGLADYPFGVFYNTEECDKCYVLVTANPHSLLQLRVKTILKWNETESDTIVCDTDPDWLYNVKTVYFNGDLKWEWKKSQYPAPRIDIVK